MKTQATETLHMIEWGRGDKVDNHDGYVEYNAFGTSLDGREWVGSWMEMSGECCEIDNIELA